MNMMIFDKVLKIVAEEHAIGVNELFEKNRRGPVMQSRRIIIYILRKKYKWTYQHIGRKLEKHHATVMHHFKQMDFWVEEDVSFKSEIDDIISKITFDPIRLSKQSFINKIMTETIIWHDKDATEANFEKLFEIEL